MTCGIFLPTGIICASWLRPQTSAVGRLVRRRASAGATTRPRLFLFQINLLKRSGPKRSGIMPPISGLFLRRFAIVRPEMWSPSAGAHQVAMVWYIKPSPKIFRSWLRVRIVAIGVMNKNLFRWHCCRDMENIFNLTLGQHGSTH